MSDPPDPFPDLISLAREDLVSAQTLMASGATSSLPVCFHAQQAVEKALKAVLADRDVHYPFSHDLTRLYELCGEHGLTLPPELGQAERLTPYAAAGRYGGVDLPEVAPADAIRWASLAVEWAASVVRPSGG